MEMTPSELRAFYRIMQPKLLAWMRKRVGEEADVEELVQDCFLSFIDSLPLYRGEASLWTFLVSIARHEVADFWRKRYAKKVILTVPFMDQVYHEKLYSSHEAAVVLEKVYERLMPEERIVLIWKYEENLTVAQIAHYLCISIKAAESRLFRARKAFKLAFDVVNSE